MRDVNWVALSVFVVLFGFVSWLGFAAARWRRGDLDQLHEWGLGGRRFGTVITWFLMGGDLYTAYTFIAVPALAFGAGAVAFFAVPYTILAYPILFLVFPRIWRVCRARHYITAGDFVHGMLGNRWLALAVTVTGIVATMPYIALQLIGLQVVIGALGISGQGLAADLPLIFAFIILAAFTYSSGLRAPASIAIVKDILIYITVFAAIIVIPVQLGGFEAIFAAVPAQKLLLAVPDTAATTGSYSAYVTLAVGSACAVLLYPHAFTGILSASSSRAIRRNAAILPAYSIMLGLLALLGFFAIGVAGRPEYADGFKEFGSNFAVPALFLHSFPSWFVGIAFAAIGIGALVPAAIMSIAAANLYTRNIHREFFNKNPTDRQEAQIAKWVSLFVKLGGLVFIILAPTKYAIQLQLLGGIWIIQTMPAILAGAFHKRWFNGWAILAGWAAGSIIGTVMAVQSNLTPTYLLAIGEYTFPGYAAVYSVLVNLVVIVALTPLLNAVTGRPGPIEATHIDPMLRLHSE